jgi:ATP-dependent DNA helicase RecQ
MRFLREQIDDPDASDRGRCDNCGGRTLPGEVGADAVSAATSVLGRPGVAFEPRRMWPSAMPCLGVDIKGKVPPADQAEAGRAIARLTEHARRSRSRSSRDCCAKPVPVPSTRSH